MGFILFILAHVLVYPLTVINYFNVPKNNRKGYFRDTAKSIDVWACREFRATWNKLLIHANGYRFGKEGETISSALGKNIQLEALTKTGKVLVFILTKKHCLDAIEK